MHQAIDVAARLVSFADDPATAGAAGNLVGTDDLSRAALARAHAVTAQTADSLRSFGIRRRCVLIADDSSTVRAGRQARRTC